MSQIQELQTEWNQIKSQVETVQAQYTLLRRQRGGFHLKLMFPQDNRPESLAEYRQTCEQEMKKWQFNLEELDRELKSVRLKLKKVRAQLIVKQTKLYELQAQQKWPKICEQVQVVNQLAAQLEQALQILWQQAHDFQPRVGSWLPEHPQLVQFPAQVTIPTATAQDDCFAISNQLGNLP
ncbi:MAG: hypothetical protein HC835_04285 [Oscillatoriales cyanobacterium RM2_1_1]|nr:hypothetical protein [Oscillatoriales cyanobacterium SM2_3_0]NJO44899.1 hypothetical protein [Oscillatoriales cyanobacterium RM2_1_1]